MSFPRYRASPVVAAIILALVPAPPSLLHGQGQDCAALLAAIRTATASSTDHTAALSCPVTDVALAYRAYLSSASSADTSPDEMDRAFLSASAIRDRELHELALQLAGDRDLPERLRVNALRLLFLYVHENPMVTVPVMLVTPWEGDGGFCGRPGSARFIEGRPLPEDSREVVEALAAVIHDDQGAPAGVRGAAACLRNTFRPGFLADKGAVSAYAPPVDPALITLSWTCGNRFRVRNGTLSYVALSWRVDGSQDAGGLTVPPAGQDGTPVDAFFRTAAAGTTRLFFQGDEIGAVPNGGTPCAPAP